MFLLVFNDSIARSDGIDLWLLDLPGFKNLEGLVVFQAIEALFCIIKLTSNKPFS